MYDTRNFRKEYDAFLQQFPHRTAVIEDIKVRYQYGGKENAPVLLFFNGLEMQEMWILWVLYLVQRQVGGDDQRLPAAISAVHDAVDLFQCVLGATLHAEVVNNKQGIAAELVHDLISPGKAAVQLVQDSGKVRHTHRHLLLHQSVCNAPGKETFAGAHTAPEKQSKVLCTHGLPLLHIAMCMVHLRAAAIVVFKGPVQHCRVRKPLSFYPPHKVAVLLLADKDF